MTRTLRSFCFGAVLLGLFGPVAHANLILDGGFEQPYAGPGGVDTGYTDFLTGQTIASAWTVFGPTNSDVSVIPNTETSGHGGTFSVEEGSQALDLTGDYDNGAAMGVQQTISTIAGAQYLLTFYVGDFDALDGDTGPARVLVDINGSLFQTAINGNTTRGAVNWQLFSYNFTAAGANTTIGFVNGTASGVLFNGLDNVMVTATTPEPSTSVSVLAALASLAWFSRKRF